MTTIYWPSWAKLEVHSAEATIDERDEAFGEDGIFLGIMHDHFDPEYTGQNRAYYTEIAARAQLVAAIARRLKYHENKTMVLTRQLKKHAEIMGDQLNEPKRS